MGHTAAISITAQLRHIDARDFRSAVRTGQNIGWRQHQPWRASRESRRAFLSHPLLPRPAWHEREHPHVRCNNHST